MQLELVSVGKTKTAELANLEQIYLKRCQPFFKVSCQYLKTEAKVITYLATQTSFKIILTETGKLYDSLQFAHRLQQWVQQHQQLSFIVGDSAGFSSALLAVGQDQLSLSALTFPHELARVILLEQLYRAGTIWAGHPYHK